jgi:hypothetical protein
VRAGEVRVRSGRPHDPEPVRKDLEIDGIRRVEARPWQRLERRPTVRRQLELVQARVPVAQHAEQL